MSLLKELQERRTHVLEELNRVEDLRAELADFDRVIAALEPAHIVNTDEGWELEPETQAGVEIPEGFTKWEGGAFPFDFDDKVHLYLANGEYRWDTNAALWLRRFESGEVLAYHVIKASAQDETPDQGASESVVQTSPGEAEESRDQFEEEAQRAAAIELTADVMPDPEFIELDQETCEPIQPQWNEPQTEGYAPVVDNAEAHIQAVEAERYAQPTNPEADALAKAHDWYDPKAVAERNRFNPWGGVAHLFGKPKVDA